MGDDARLRQAVPLVFLSPGDAAELLSKVRTREVKKGETLAPMGGAPKELLIPVDETVKEVNGVPGSGAAETALPAYEPVGLDCLLDQRPFPFSVVASADSTVHAIAWSHLGPMVEKIPGLKTYLGSVAESMTVRKMDQGLKKMGCSNDFRRTLLGGLQHQFLKPGAWLPEDGGIPDYLFYTVAGKVHSYTRVGDLALEKHGTVPNQSWQLWESFLEQAPPRNPLKTATNCEIYKLPKKVVDELRQKYPQDFMFFQVSSQMVAKIRVDLEKEGRERPESLKDLFQGARRKAEHRKWKFPFLRAPTERHREAACLAMVAKFHGNEFTMQFWQERIAGTERGATLYDVGAAAERAGFQAHGFEIPEIERLEDRLFPLLARRQDQTVVVYEASAKGVTMADPRLGLRAMPLAEFKRGFGGDVLLLQPTDAFYKIKPPKRGYWHFITAMKGHSFEGGIVLALSMLITVLSMIPAFITQFIIDHVLAKKDPRMLAVGIIAALVLAGVLDVSRWLRNYYLAFLNSRIDLEAISGFMQKLYSLPYKFFATRHVGEFTRRISELERIRRFMTTEAVSTLLSFLNLFFYGTVLVLYSLPVAAVIFISAPLLTGFSIVFSRFLESYYNESFASNSEMDSVVTDQIRGIGTIKTLGAELAARWRVEESLVRKLTNRHALRIMQSNLAVISSFASSAINYAVMGLAAWFAIQGDMSPGQVISITILARGVIDPFYNLASMWTSIEEMRTVADRLNDVYFSDSEAAGGASKNLVAVRLKGKIELKDVWFRYGGEGSEWALKGLSMTIEPGERVAIVGPSGSGKSTLALLACGLHEPEKGRVLIDGRDLKEYDRQWLRRQIGLLLQETDLFHGSVLENIAFGDSNPDVSRVDWAAEQANAKDFIYEKAARYDYMITHGGRGLSGGQKQRISIARILYTDPTILFLDEGTSALDMKSEKAVLGSLKENTGRTLVSIQHHPPKRVYDRIFVLEDGKVTQSGSHEELLQKPGFYRDTFLEEDAA